MALTLFFPTQVIRHLFLATVPLVAFVIFGPQSDLLACWFGWLPCYPRTPKPEWTATPIALATPCTPRPHTRTLPRGSLSSSKEKSPSPSDHQFSSPVTRIGASTINDRGLPHESHLPNSPAYQPSLVSSHSAVPILQTPKPHWEQPPPYPPTGDSGPGVGAVQIAESAHVSEKRGERIPQAMEAIRQTPTSPEVPIILIQSPSLPGPSVLRELSDSL